MALPNYVKFQRGTIATYNRLAQKDNNTLYFVYENIDSETGNLYLGDKLISNNVGGSGINNLSELADVIVTGANTGDFLVLNSEGKWAAVSAIEVAQLIYNQSGSGNLTIDTNVFQFNAVNGSLELKGYNSAADNLVPVKTSNGLAWINLPIDLSSQVGDLKTRMSAATTAINTLSIELQNVDGKINTAIANANHLSYAVVNNLQAITANNVIYLTPSATSSTNNFFEEYMLINGNLERIGDTSLNLSSYATTSSVLALDSRINTLETQFNSLTAVVSTLNDNLITLTTAVSVLRNDIDNIEFQSVTGNFVLTSTFNAVIGDISIINGVENNLNADDSIADTLLDIYQILTWQDIRE